MDEHRLNIHYNSIGSYEEVNEEDLEEKLKENIVAIYYAMEELERPKCERMKERVAEVKEYIEILKKK